jgi:DNA ligase-1
MKLMLAADLAKIDFSFKGVRFPKFVSPKLDGIRAVIQGGTVYTRNMKPIPNEFVQEQLSTIGPQLDGELIVGPPNGVNVFGTTMSGVRSALGMPDFKFHVFDLIVHDAMPYEQRLKQLTEIVRLHANPRVIVVPQKLAWSEVEVLEAEVGFLELGYEGVMLRSVRTPYKHGRCSPTDDDLWKLKRFIEGEAVVTNVEEADENTNAAFLDELGRTKRSSAQAGKVGKGMVGAIIVHDLKYGAMRLSPGIMPHSERAELWARNGGEPLIGTRVQWRAFGYGMKDKPRFPRYYGVRFDK